MSEELFREALAHLKEVVSIHELDGTILYMNPATERLWGKTFDEVRGHQVFELFPAGVTKEPFERVAAGGPAEELEQYSPLAGAWFASRLVRVGNHVHIHGRDVSAEVRNRRRLETLARISEAVTSGDQDATSTLRAVAQILTDVLDAECTLALLSSDGEWLDVAARASRDAATLEVTGSLMRWRAEIGTPGEALRTRTTVLVVADPKNEIDAEQRSIVERYDPTSVLVVPLIVDDAPIGVVIMSRRRASLPLTRDDRDLTAAVAPSVALSIALARAHVDLLEASETRAALIQASPAAIALVDEAGTVLVWNPAAEAMLRRPAAEAIGRAHAFASDPQWQADLQAVLAGNAIYGRHVHRTRDDGTAIDVELYVVPVRLSNGRTLCLSMAVDITERKRVERSRQLVANAISIFSRSLDLQQTLREILRVPLAGLADRAAVDLLIDGETIERLTLNSPSLPGDLTPERLHHDGSHFESLRGFGPRSTVSVPLLAGDRVLGTLTLVSRTRNFDDLDVSIAAELAGHAATAIENARLFEDARNARQDAENANRAKDEFVAMLGHELRNPLAPMSTALELMRMKGSGQLERERAVIARQVHHLSRLVDDLLDVSRITRGKIDLHRERVALSTIVAKAIEQTSPLLEQRNHRLVVDVPTELAVIADPLRLGQVIANLVSNAAKYTMAGGLVEVRGHREGEHVVVVVRDNGIGIAPEILPHVFGLFVQAPQSSARPAGGLGLGLTIVRSLVELHGGAVRVDSEGVDKGTAVTVTLPTAGEAPVIARADSPRHITRTTASRRILVVDDNEDAAMLLASVLEAHGHVMRTAFDGPSALRIADEFRPEVAVLDIGLPVMDGYELAQRLKTSPEFGGLRLIAVTGYGQESDRERAQAAGFRAHLAKPVPIETLVRLVDEAG